MRGRQGRPSQTRNSSATAVKEREPVTVAPQTAEAVTPASEATETPVAVAQPEPTPTTTYYDIHLLYGVIRCCVVDDRVVSSGHRMDWMVGKHIHDLKTQVYAAGGTIRRVGPG